MKHRRLLWQLYPSYLLITLLSLLAVTIYTARSLYSFFLDETASNLEARARLIEPEVQNLLAENELEQLQVMIVNLGERSGTRITIIRPNGVVIADSEKDPVTMDNHGDRPEVQVALQANTGTSSRFSDTLKEEMMYVAAPVYNEQGEIAIVIRTSKSLKSVNEAIQMLLMSIGIGSLIIAVLAAIVSWVNARRIALPIERMKFRARRIAAGDVSERLPEEGSEELAALAEAINLMLIQLDDRFHIIERQRREQEAVFGSISDGVLAVDADARVLRINKAAAKMFDLQRSRARGRKVSEVITNEALREFIYDTLKTSGDTESEILLGDLDPRYMQTHGRPLKDETGSMLGAVVVINDITRLRRLEKARRDFVANVSHELRTPVTSIIGYLDTLESGALEDQDALRKFIGIISRQSARLDAIIEDLLALARIERDAEGEGIELTPASIDEVVQGAITSTHKLADDKDIGVEFQPAGNHQVLINPPLLEQALINLLSNAIKYSDSGTRVIVCIKEKQKYIAIQVIDQGIGIEHEHLPRIFERFYRVDKGRSRQEGGTGLGLAIVKHIALAHGGKVSVASEPGAGAKFSILLPKNLNQVEQVSPLDDE